MTQENAAKEPLEITGGLHAGGRLPLTKNGMMVLGSAMSCDLILRDEGVCERHCLVAMSGGSVHVRPLDGIVVLGDGGRVQPPESVVLEPGRAFQIGAAELTLSESGAEAQPENGGPRDGTATAREGVQAGQNGRGDGLDSPRWKIAAAVVVGSALTLTGIAYAMVGSRQSEDLAKGQSQLESSENEVAGAGADNDSSGDPETGGGARNQERDGDALAESVNKVLRLSGIQARTEYKGDGEVRVIGHFGDGDRVSEVIKSRSMRAVDGLERIVQVNLSKKAEGEASQKQADRHRVRRMVGGEDPYLVLDDGSRMYPGATIASGAVFRGVSGGKAMIDYGDTIRLVEAAGRPLEELAEVQGEVEPRQQVDSISQWRIKQ